MSASHDYARQAETYDRTRAASPSVLGPLVAALEDAPGPYLLDVGGGTGNYARTLREHGFLPLVVDVNEAMLLRAKAKGLPTLAADAAKLPMHSASVDAIVMISMLHHVPEWRVALAEAKRILRPGGRLALQVFTAENLRVHWALELFPSMQAFVGEAHPPLHALLDEVPGARAMPFGYTDLQDGTLAALCRHPELLFDPARRAQTSFFERLAQVDPHGLRAGLVELEARLRAGWRPGREKDELRNRVGDGTVIAWSKAGRSRTRPPPRVAAAATNGG